MERQQTGELYSSSAKGDQPATCDQLLAQARETMPNPIWKVIHYHVWTVREMRNEFG